MQFVEGLTDLQAAEAVRARIDSRYALGLELDDPGFDFSVLSVFRDRLAGADAGRRVLDGILAGAREKRLLKSEGRASPKSSTRPRTIPHPRPPSHWKQAQSHGS